MNKASHASFNNRFKAKIAIEAIGGTPVEKLFEEYGVKPADIKKWVSRLKRQAELIFLEDDQQADMSDLKKPGSPVGMGIKDYASLLSTTFEAIPGGVMVVDLDGKVITYNQECMEMWGIPQEVVATGDIRKAMNYIVGQLEKPTEFRKNVQNLYDNPEIESRYRFRFRDGRTFERYSIPHRLGGEIVGRVTSFVDITDRIKAEVQANRYGEMLESITTNVNEGILRSTPKEGLIYVNDTFVKMFGYGSREEIMKISPESFYADKDHRWNVLDQLTKNTKVVNKEVLFKRKDGSTFWGLENSILVKGDGREYIDAVINDITERKKSEEAIRESEEKYRSILRNIEEGYFETNLKGDFTFFNRSLVDMLGYLPEEMLGMNNREYMDEENSAKVFQSFNKVFKTGKSQRVFDWELIKKDGSRIIVESSVNRMEKEDGTPVGFRGMVRDITERKEREEQIKISLKEKEILLGEIHHRVKNNLAVISGLLYLQTEKTDEAPAKDLLRQSQSRINSMGIVHELLYENQTFAHIDTGKYIEQLVKHVTQNLHIGDKDIETKIKTGNLKLDMNIAIPCALIINELLTNAYKYAFEGRESGLIEVSLTQKKDRYKLIVKDNGVGLTKDQLQNDNQKGLGLFLVKTLTKQIHGELTVKNKTGTQLTITFAS